MPVFTVHQGKRYPSACSRALSAMRWSPTRSVRWASPKSKVSGSGRNRLGKGLWPHADASAEVPPEITSVKEIEV